MTAGTFSSFAKKWYFKFRAEIFHLGIIDAIQMCVHGTKFHGIFKFHFSTVGNLDLFIKSHTHYSALKISSNQE